LRDHSRPSNSTNTVAAPIHLVLDTNVVIDWLVFDDPYMTPVRAQVGSDRLAVLSHELAIEEFARVLTYPALKLTDARRAEVLARYRSHTRPASMPSGFALSAWQLPSGFPSCRDRDDDLFLALAYHSQATALVTRDKALLKMRKRVRKYSLSIWNVQQMIDALIESSAASALESR